MRGKLEIMNVGKWLLRGHVIGAPEMIWAEIQADREIVRKETREELLKDHVKIGEIIEVPDGLGGWVDTVACLWALKTREHYTGSSIVEWRRPSKKRPRTREEKIKKLKEHLAERHAWLPDGLKDSTLDDLCTAFEIDTGVEYE